LNCLSRFGVVWLDQSINVKNAEYVIELVLKDAGEPTVRIDCKLVAVQVCCCEGGTVASAEWKPFPRDGQAPFEFLVFIERANRRWFHKHRWVDRNAAMLHIIFVDPVVDEQCEIDSNLRCGQTDTGCEFHRGKHVVNQLFEVVINVLDLGARAVQHGISRDDDVPYTHRSSLMSVA
jgi:hypothetical protein